MHNKSNLRSSRTTLEIQNLAMSKTENMESTLRKMFYTKLNLYHSMNARLYSIRKEELQNPCKDIKKRRGESAGVDGTPENILKADKITTTKLCLSFSI